MSDKGMDRSMPTKPIRRIAMAALGFAAIVLVLAWSQGAAPAYAVHTGNDAFANAVVIGTGSPAATDSTVGATVEGGEPLPCGFIGSTIWFSFTPAVNSLVTVDTINSNYDTVVAAYTGNALNTLTLVACDDDTFGLQSEIIFLATAGVTYHIQAGGFDVNTGDLTLNLSAVELGPASIEVSKTAEVDGFIVSGTISITNVGDFTAFISNIADTLEVHFPRRFDPPALPLGSTPNWFKVADVPVANPGEIPPGETVNINYSVNACGLENANSMRNVVAVTVSNRPEGAQRDTVVTRSESFKPPPFEPDPVCDAGDLPETAQVPVGAGALNSISGTLSGVSDVDMFQVCLPGGGTFSAATVAPGSATFDTQLFLFDSAGIGVYMNDDEFPSGAPFHSLLPAGHALTPADDGVYYLAVSAFNADPVSAGGAIFPAGAPFDAVNGPTGAGGAQPVSGWTAHERVGVYTIALTGAEFC